jgi:hypothetical protein
MTKTLDALMERFGGYWDGEHPEYTLADWRQLVAENDTRLGYWEWVLANVEATAE